MYCASFAIFGAVLGVLSSTTVAIPAPKVSSVSLATNGSIRELPTTNRTGLALLTIGANAVPYVIPDTRFPIELSIEEGPSMALAQPESVFQVLTERVAELASHDYESMYPGTGGPYIFGDCSVLVDNPATLELMTYEVAIEALRGIGEFMLQQRDWEKSRDVRIIVDDYAVGKIVLGHAGVDKLVARPPPWGTT